jgi:hypothetical protein
MIAGTAGGSVVAKKKAGRPKAQDVRGIGKPVRLDPDLVAKADMIARRRGSKVGPYLSGLLEGPINREYAALLKELSRLEGGE